MSNINVSTRTRLNPLSVKDTKSLNGYTVNLDGLQLDKNEEAIISEAIKIGYLIYPSKDIIWQLFQKQPIYYEFEEYLDSQPKATKHRHHNYHHHLTHPFALKADEYADEAIIDMNFIKFLNMSQLHILEIGDVCFCENLQILNLSNNYIIRIEPLMQCMNLIRLDLSNNQIAMLPETKYWSTFKKLKVLYLHNNPISRIDNLRRMAACSTLEALTMFDTPLSLKKNYRHHVVNIILSLKALDGYVVSDEEIIEDAHFNNQFSAKSSALRINLYIPPLKTNNFYDEIHATNLLIKHINFIQAHYNPVIIIQKYMRGYLTRKYSKFQKDAKLWAAVKIQRWWRKIKNIDYKPNLVSRALKKRSANLAKHNISFSTTTKTNIDSPGESIVQSQDEFTGLKKRNMTTTPASNRNNIIIDLNKLQNRSSSMIEVLINQAEARTESGYPLFERSRSDIDLYQQYSVSQHSRKSTSAKSRRSKKSSSRKLNMEKFFDLGDLLSKLAQGFEMRPSQQAPAGLEAYIISEPEMTVNLKNNAKEAESDDENGQLFRLPVYVANKAEINEQNRYIVDLINEKKFYRNVVQQLELEAHRKMNEIRENVEISDKKTFKTNDQRFFQKIYGTMALGCLRAVDKAYMDRSVAELKQAKLQNVSKTKEIKEYTRQQVNYYREERLREVQKLREKDKLHVTISRRRLDLERMQIREQVQENRFKSRDLNLDRRKDILLAVDFNKQHLSVSKALQKHEYNLKKEDKLKQNNNFVERQRIALIDQQEMVKKYIKQRNILRLAQTVADREKVDAKVLQDANKRLLSAKRRVTKFKAAKDALNAYYSTIATKGSERSISSYVIPPPMPGRNTVKTPPPPTVIDNMRAIMESNLDPTVQATNERASSKNDSSLSEYYNKRYEPQQASVSIH